MTTIVNTPASGEKEGSGVSMIIGLIILLVVILFLFFYGLPLLRNNNQPAAQPDNGQSGVTVPDKINIDVNQKPAQY